MMVFSLVDGTVSFKMPKLIQLYSKNQFKIFLVANVLTGLINLIFDTGKMKKFESLLIMVIYKILICIFVYKI